MTEIQSVSLLSANAELRKKTYANALIQIRREITALPKLNIHTLISSSNMMDNIIKVARRELKTFDIAWLDQNKKLISDNLLLSIVKYYSTREDAESLFNTARLNLWLNIIKTPEAMEKKYLELRDGKIKKINPDKLDSDIDIAEAEYAVKYIDGIDTADAKRRLTAAISARYTAYQSVIAETDSEFIKNMFWEPSAEKYVDVPLKDTFNVSEIASIAIASVFIKNGGMAYAYLLTDEKMPIFAVMKMAVQSEKRNQNWRRAYCNWLPIYKYGYMLMRDPEYNRLRKEIVYWHECRKMAELMSLPDYADSAASNLKQARVALSKIISEMEYEYMQRIDQLLLENEIVTVSVCRPTTYILFRSIALLLKRIPMKIFGE